jgi:hypothetical protein
VRRRSISKWRAWLFLKMRKRGKVEVIKIRGGKEVVMGCLLSILQLTIHHLDFKRDKQTNIAIRINLH